MTEAYLSSTKNLANVLQTLKNAKAPSRFTQKFLEDLGFKSTPDRLVINVLKGLGFLSSDGAPTEAYSRFLDDTQSKLVLSEGIRKAYDGLFNLSIKANELSNTDVVNKLKTVFSGQKGEEVLKKMTMTFRALVALADFSQTEMIKKLEEPRKEDFSKNSGFYNQGNFDDPNLIPLIQKNLNTQLHYNIQIHLPETKDLAVYDAIFESLKKHLL